MTSRRYGWGNYMLYRNGQVLTHDDIDPNCLEEYDGMKFSSNRLEDAWRQKEYYEWNMRSLGIDVEVAVMYRDLDGSQCEITLGEDGEFAYRRVGRMVFPMKGTV